MEPININYRKEKCSEVVEKLIKEAKKQALHEFRSFPSKIQIELQNSIEDENTILTRLLNIEFGNYDKILNVRDMKKLKIHLLTFFINSKEIYDNELNFQEFGYDAQLRRLMLQFLIVKKIDYFKGRIDIFKETQTPLLKEKIEWLGTPSQFGLLINLLVLNGYIKKAKHKKQKGKDSWAPTAKLLCQAFYIPNQQKDGETGDENIRKEISQPSITFKEHGFFKITQSNI